MWHGLIGPLHAISYLRLPRLKAQVKRLSNKGSLPRLGERSTGPCSTLRADESMRNQQSCQMCRRHTRLSVFRIKSILTSIIRTFFQRRMAATLAGMRAVKGLHYVLKLLLLFGRCLLIGTAKTRLKSRRDPQVFVLTNLVRR